MARADRYTCTIVVQGPKADGLSYRPQPEEIEGEGLTVEDALSDAIQRLPLMPATRKLLAEALR